MEISYHQKDDVLVLALSYKDHPDIFPFATDNVTVEIDLDEERQDEEDVISVVIHNAKAVVKDILATGILGDHITEPSAKGMVWYEADSSMIKSFGYDEAEQILEVVFQSGEVYQYFEVPSEVVEGLLKADSAGRYMQANIIDMYLNEKK